MIRKNNISKAIVFLFCFGVNIYAQVNDSLKIDYNYINSDPQNAEVYINDEFEGKTPLFFTWKDTTFPKLLKITIQGYADYFEYINSSLKLNKTYALIPLKGTSKVELVNEDSGIHFKKPRKFAPIILSSLVAIGGAVSAFHFRNLSLEVRDAFEINRDPAELDKKNKYDVLSGISVMVFQTGLFFLTYFLFVD